MDRKKVANRHSIKNKQNYNSMPDQRDLNNNDNNGDMNNDNGVDVEEPPLAKEEDEEQEQQEEEEDATSLEGLISSSERSRRRRRTNNNNATMTQQYLDGTQQDSSCSLFAAWAVKLFIFAIAIIGLLVWRSHNSHHDYYTGGSVDIVTVGTTTTTAGNPTPDATTKQSMMDDSTSSTSVPPHHQHFVHYNPNAFLQQQNLNPFDFRMDDDDDDTNNNNVYGTNILQPPRLFDNQHYFQAQDPDLLGYLQHPNIYNNTLVFCAEGDVYLTNIEDWSSQQQQSRRRMPAMKLTTTVGNAMDPKINPTFPYWLAYTATYSGRRDVYLLDLRGARTPALRLTYWDTSSGVHGLVGWMPDGQSLLFSARSTNVSMPDERLYKIQLGQAEASAASPTTTTTTTSSSLAVFGIQPVPLSQAIDGVYVDKCLYFVRFSQSSQTIRYTGGTAENLWVYCQDGHEQQLAYKLFNDNYRGTSKSPQLYNDNGNGKNGNGKNGEDPKYLFFLSDRGYVSKEQQEALGDDAPQWVPERMNIWAVPLSSGSAQTMSSDALIQITNTACDFEGRTIREFTIDPATLNVVVRIGADLYYMDANKVHGKLQQGRRPRRRMEEKEEKVTIVQEQGEEATAMGETENEPGKTENLQVESSSTEPTGTRTDYSERVEAETDPAMTRSEVPSPDHHSGHSTELTRLPIIVHSDFSTSQERIVPVSLTKHLRSADVYYTAVGSTHMLMTLRGQIWVAPVVPNSEVPPYAGAGMNLPERSYRVGPGAMMGGLVRILGSRHVPNPIEDDTSDRRLAVALATDPLSPTAEHALYLIETQSDIIPIFLDLDDLPTPFLGGHASGGSTAVGGLGSIKSDSMVVSPCGRRMAWTDTDGRIVVMTLPHYQNVTNLERVVYTVLPNENELGEPMMGDEVDLSWSPGGRYLAVNHNARNQFRVISIADVGDPESSEDNKVADIQVGRIVMATPDRFNSFSMYWGKSRSDISTYNRNSAMSSVFGLPEPENVATTLFFLTDRDITTDVFGPWGTRQPSPHFTGENTVYALPLIAKDSEDPPPGRFTGGGAAEVHVDEFLKKRNEVATLLASKNGGGHRHLAQKFHGMVEAFGRKLKGQKRRRIKDEEEPWQAEKATNSQNTTESGGTLESASFPKDADIDFGPVDLKFARSAYRLASIPKAKYIDILSQTWDDGSFVLIEDDDDTVVLNIFIADDYPSDTFKSTPFLPIKAGSPDLVSFGTSTCRQYIFIGYSPGDRFKVVANTAKGIATLLGDVGLKEDIVDAGGIHLSIWPWLEYRQMYSDAWRMLRDYFYDPEMTGLDWPAIHDRYFPLVSRCTKREELDDVLAQMASELSALHVFVYGGDKDIPLHGSFSEIMANRVSSFGAVLERSAEWGGYKIMNIPERDPDFSLLDGNPIYSPLSDQTLRLSGQRGLQPGDVIVGVNGESVMRAPDINLLLRGKAGKSVRLDVLRLSSDSISTGTDEEGQSGVTAEPVIVVPLDPDDADDLRYYAWEYQTKQLAQKLAKEANFTVGYVHLQSMSGATAEDAFARGFFPDFNKDAFILDVRHNRGGNIDSWVLDVLQRKAWMYWQSRDFNTRNGGLGWDEQFAFRGHIVVLIDEKTSSDGEGVSRGISELGLGRLIGARTWGGGIWLSSDNHLVDGGIATVCYTDQYFYSYTSNFGFSHPSRFLLFHRHLRLVHIARILAGDWVSNKWA
jgi:C-terminal processing protease CtpA/Prc